MDAKYRSKCGIVSLSPEQLYMNFVDMRNFTKAIPEGNEVQVSADYDNLEATVRGFKIGVSVCERTPYSLIRLRDNGAPFEFRASLHFEPVQTGKTEFHIELEANLNLMMKAIMGSKIQEALDKAVDTLANV